MRSQVLVSLLISGVFGNKVEIFTSDDKSSVHFGGDDGAGKNTAADGDLPSERTFLICSFPSVRHTMHRQKSPGFGSSRTDVRALNRSLWRPEPQSNVLVPSSAALSNLRALAPNPLCLGVDEDVWLFLVGAL